MPSKLPRQETRQAQEIAERINAILDLPVMRKNEVEADLVSGTALKIPHKLKRIPEGWIVVDKDASATVHRVSWDKNFLELQTDANVSVKVWVF